MAHCNVKCCTVGANIIINDKTGQAVIDVIDTTRRWALVKKVLDDSNSDAEQHFQFFRCLKKLMVECATLEQFQVNNIHIKWSGS